MKKFFKMFKKLPPEARMVLALVGLGSPICAIYFLRRFFPNVSMPVLILCVVGVILAIVLVIWLISLVFTRGRKKRTNRMAAELAGEAQAGPQSMDVSAAIKANNEKFFNAIRDMRKNVGISVYDLPWYIVIGDSGCGKTKLVNEGGLTFSTGKPEGYQLGTLNYNWWFTEDAIFVDMAGRLCNPQDDSDRREWSAFLDTVGKGRKGFPINGAIVCVSADHLLQDPPEKIETDANTTLERLRDIQTKLGVTFATYLLVTKCDKILGFMHSFDRAERDITVKNQIFGWSRPGDFNELYDPETFKGDFDSVYVRLNDLRLRRLNDDAEEIDLGLAYSFPEEFRRLYDPLQIYMRTLFPYIRTPRAVKNLILRGVFFTSATQEGELILKHLTERLGSEAADQFAPLDDLYPNKRPHFIKDVLFKKVFLEQGLVFRNEQQVIRNRQLSKVLKVATAVIAVVLVGVFAWSSSAFKGIIGDPRQNAEQAAKSVHTITPDGALQRAGVIGTDVNKLKKQPWAARVLSGGVGTDRPVNDLERIRLALVERSLLQALTDVDQTLSGGVPLKQSPDQHADRFMHALVEYLRWYGCTGASVCPSQLTLESFNTLCAVVTDSDSIIRRQGFDEHVGWYFNTLTGEGPLRGNPARLFKNLESDPPQTIRAAIGHVYDDLERYATLDENHPDERVREWMRIEAACERVEENYARMLTSTADRETIETLDGLREFQSRFVNLYDTFDNSLGECEWRDGYVGSGTMEIRKLRTGLQHQRGRWVDYENRLREALGTCSLSDPSIDDTIASLTKGGTDPPRRGLDQTFWRSLQTKGIVKIDYREGVYEEDQFELLVSETYELYSEILVFMKGNALDIPDRLSLTESTESTGIVRGLLRPLRDSLAGADFAVPQYLADQTPDVWTDALRIIYGADAEEGEAAADGVDVSGLTAYWRPGELNELQGHCQSLVQLGEGTRLLKTIATRLEQVQQPGTWGFAELLPYDDWAAVQQSPYTIEKPQRVDDGREREARTRGEETDLKPPTTPSRLRLPPSERSSERSTRHDRRTPTPESRGSVSRGRGQVPACATHAFLHERAEELAELLFYLTEMRGRFLPEGDELTPLNERCKEELERSARAYMDTYVEAWSTAYRDKKLITLDDLRSGVSSWEGLAAELSTVSQRRRIAEEFTPALRWILRAVPFGDYDPDGFSWESRSGPEWPDVSSWFRASVAQRWNTTDVGYFATSTRADVADTALNKIPWETIGSDFHQAWFELAEAVAANARLDRRVGERTIPWGELGKLREVYGLEDERLTKDLLEFELWARRMLSTRLTQLLVEIQRDHLGEDNPDGGWPYLRGESYTRSGLDTADFQRFVDFLVAVQRAKEDFQELEEGLRDGLPGSKERREFYEACESWFSFLRLTDEPDALPEELRLTVFGDDPLRDPFRRDLNDGCQFTARWLDLDLGFGGIVRTACARENWKREGHEVTWPWRGYREGELQVGLAEVLTGVNYAGAKTLGKYSPLALCAYLHRYGNSQDQITWYVTHAFDVERRALEGSKQNEQVGQKLRFELLQPLPKPIGKLSEASTSVHRRR